MSSCYPATHDGELVAAQVKAKYGDGQGSIVKATLRREATLIQRNSFIYIFRAVQVLPSRDPDSMLSTGGACLT